MQKTVVKVFVDDEERHGDNVPIVIDEGKTITLDERVALANKLDGVETVFINDLATNNISIIHSRPAASTRPLFRVSVVVIIWVRLYRLSRI